VPIIADSEHLLVPTIVLYEVCKKLTVVKELAYVEEFIKGMLNAQVIPLDTSLSLRAADVSREYRLALADSIIYATVIKYDAVLWTADKHFDGLPNVRYFDKTQQK
jgi:predicted nucleic acid-binding protein